jgi:hypothetical protein
MSKHQKPVASGKHKFGGGLLVGLAALLAQEGSAGAQSQAVLLDSKVVPIVKLAGLDRRTTNGPVGEGVPQPATSVTLTPPSGDITGFGAGIATDNDGAFDYLLIGAPGANGGRGRAFVYKKDNNSSTFMAPVELNPGSLPAGAAFGTGLVINLGMIVVGAPGMQAAFSFTQPHDSSGFPDNSQNVYVFTQLGGPQSQFSDSAFGRQIAMGGISPNPLVVCGNLCQTYYPVADGSGFTTTVFWNQTSGSRAGTSGGITSTAAPALALIDSSHLSIYPNNSSDPRFFTNSPFTFSPPSGTSGFTGSVDGFLDIFLVGVKNAPGSQLWVYSKPPSQSNWTQGSAGVVTFPSTLMMGASMAELGDKWLVSNANAAGSTGVNSGSVWTIALNRMGTQYTYSDDVWTPTSLANGGLTFGAGLGLASSYLAIGEPASNNVTLLGNDQHLVLRTLGIPNTSNGTLTVTLVEGSPDPTITVIPSCSGVATNMFQAGQSTGPCVQVTLNSAMIGSATVCYPNPSHSNGAAVLRCAPPPDPAHPLLCNGSDMPRDGLCCLHLPATAEGTDPICALTDHFSALASGPLLADVDGDFTPDIDDNCPTIRNDNQADQDSDHVGDVCDNCPTVSNRDQADNDHDGIGNACDPTPGSPVPVPPMILPLFGLLLALAGALAIRRSSLA